MPVYVDQPMTWAKLYKNYCHMYADTVDELHAMAAKLGLRRSWFQADIDHPHYDIASSKRRLAIQYGAVEFKTPAEQLAWIKQNRAKRLAAESDGE
jgi:hypothetical protein